MPEVDRASRRPRIAQVGQVVRVDGTVQVSGFVLGACVPACRCHLNPFTNQLVVLEDQARGLLGVRSFRSGGCACCRPWTAEELEAVVRDLQSIAAIVAIPQK